MAKGGYMCICYPEDLKKAGVTVSDLVESIQSFHGECAYILHDKDTCNPHFHFIAMWSKDPMPWDDVVSPKRGILQRLGFKSWMQQHFCIAPPKHPKSKDDKWCYSVAVIKDIDAALSYLLHE